MTEAESDADTPEVAHQLTAFQQTILVVLAEETRYGLAIKRALEAYYGTEVNHGRLYPNLDELADMGLIEKSKLDDRTNEYALTDAGKDALLEQLEWVFSKYVTTDARANELRDRIDATR